MQTLFLLKSISCLKCLGFSLLIAKNLLRFRFKRSWPGLSNDWMRASDRFEYRSLRGAVWICQFTIWDQVTVFPTLHFTIHIYIRVYTFMYNWLKYLLCYRTRVRKMCFLFLQRSCLLFIKLFSKNVEFCFLGQFLLSHIANLRYLLPLSFIMQRFCSLPPFFFFILRVDTFPPKK